MTHTIINIPQPFLPLQPFKKTYVSGYSNLTKQEFTNLNFEEFSEIEALFVKYTRDIDLNVIVTQTHNTFFHAFGSSRKNYAVLIKNTYHNPKAKDLALDTKSGIERIIEVAEKKLPCQQDQEHRNHRLLVVLKDRCCIHSKWAWQTDSLSELKFNKGFIEREEEGEN